MLNFIKKVIIGFIFKQIIIGALLGLSVGLIIACIIGFIYNIDLLTLYYQNYNISTIYLIVWMISGAIAKILPW